MKLLNLFENIKDNKFNNKELKVKKAEIGVKIKKGINLLIIEELINEVDKIEDKSVLIEIEVQLKTEFEFKEQ